MRKHSRHVLMCTGPRCTEGGARAEAMFLRLGEEIDACLGLDVKRTRSHCFAVCRHGPVLVVYPDGVWYHRVDEAALQRIVVEHLKGGREVSGHVFHRTGDGDVRPPECGDA